MPLPATTPSTTRGWEVGLVAGGGRRAAPPACYLPTRYCYHSHFIMRSSALRIPRATAYGTASPLYAGAPLWRTASCTHLHTTAVASRTYRARQNVKWRRHMPPYCAHAALANLHRAAASRLPQQRLQHAPPPPSTSQAAALGVARHGGRDARASAKLPHTYT